MHAEIDAAVEWLGSLILDRSLYLNDPRSAIDAQTREYRVEQLRKFQRALTAELEKRFRGNWYEAEPKRKQGYRCIHVTPQFGVNEFLKAAADAAGIEYELLNIHTLNFTLWIDPGRVSARYNEGDRIIEIRKVRRFR